MAICRFFQAGRCLNGESCSFQHFPNTQNQATITASPLALNAAANSFRPSQDGNVNTRSKPPCTFFLQGACKRGAFCNFEHAGLPTVVTPKTVSKDARSNIVCIFFQKNACNKGEECSFSHEIKSKEVHGYTPSKVPTSEGLAPSVWASSHPFTSRKDDKRTIGGATVTFEDGVSVAQLSMPTDFSAVSMSDIPLDTSIQDILALMNKHGFPSLSPDCIHLKRIPTNSLQTAQIRVADPDFASNLLQHSGPVVFIDNAPVFLSKMQLGGQSESGSNRLQLTGVICTWHNPSLVAYLQYEGDRQATLALNNFGKNSSKQLDGRKLEITYHPGSSLHVRNLNPSTTKTNLRKFLRFPYPQDISLGSRSHNLTAKQLEDTVKTSLESHGTLIEWVVNAQAGAGRVKAIAKFTEAEAARNAVKKLNDTLIDPTSNDKLRVTHLISIKLSVSYRTLTAVRPQLDALGEQSWKSDYVTIKTYEPLGKQYTQVRIFGQSKEAVARVKSVVEKLLAGHVAVDNGKPIADSFFFKHSSAAFIEDLMSTHGVFISQDPRKIVLRLYGAPLNVELAQNALAEKATELKEQSHIIILDPKTLNFALKGGFRHIVAVLGKEKVKMDIVSNPKQIIVQGSEKHLAQVQDILQSQASLPLEARVATLSFVEGEDEEVCPVCWTPPDEPFKTHCGHIYCSSCLASQCSSTDAFPLHCLGASATCKTPLSLPELKEVLPACDYETLLQTALTLYIRSRPTEFQYCPTPDCDRFYRASPTTDPRVFDCDGCLNSICTGCHQDTHDGLTCDVYKALAKAAHDGEEELEKWKKENDVRNCPKCSVAIEKASGCNHMECMACGTHICWFCMKTFRRGSETYDHMSKNHESWNILRM
ncbi:uncharacterized protein BDR25DRAFT_306323 [Lindgomyces ingoldianus]|uniref:Uncharacterized protein n=1 Tax=Lindgomyces ingoldianus TaxID=673940 RepID=A0ACB6QGV1_9PLEO|nr:uncharacterized protein BDR25DRAFT_306323 [Lindgomyces ingoldianus]KAF2466149.1 hypothetical protein BDR25DRAFT_306323 [Lindgomyces ingoldianus]